MTPVLIGISCSILIGLAFATWKAPRLTSTLLWSLTAAFAICAAISQVSPGSELDRASFFAVGMPVVWAGLQFWCYWHASKWRVVGGLVSLTAIGSAVAVIG